MYPGKRYTILCGLLWLLATGAAAQDYRFRYLETVRSDYGGIMRAGAAPAKRTDTIIQEGRLSVHRNNDSVLSLRLQLERQQLPGAVANTAVAEGLVTLDAAGRIQEFIASTPSLTVFIQSLSWLGALHFYAPQAIGMQNEIHSDGKYRVEYTWKGKHLLQKKHPQVSYPHATRQALLFDAFDSELRFATTGSLRSLQFHERKRQYIGRQALACIERQLTVTEETGTTASTAIEARSGWQTVAPYTRLNESERRRRISANLLGNADLGDLRKELAGLDPSSNEDRFRLKSRWRALLILDTSSRAAAILLYESQDAARQDLLEDAMLESGLFGEYFARRIDSLSANYTLLRPLLMKVSLAGVHDEAILQSLRSLLRSNEANISGLAALTLANLLPPLREEAPTRYNELSSLLMEPYRQPAFDTLQYLYIVGNAGIASEWPRLSLLFNGPFHTEVLAALRHIHNEDADEMLFGEALLRDSMPAAYYNGLLAGRSIPPQWVILMSARIRKADASGSAALLPAMQFLLDEAYRSHLALDDLQRSQFKTAAYRDELADFQRAGSLCNGWPN